MVAGSVLARADNLLEPCNADDIQCLRRTAEKFLDQTYKGVPAYNILAIDPLVIPSLDIAYDNDGLVYKNLNLTVTGLKHQNLSDFKMDSATKSVVMTTETYLHIESDITVIFNKSGRSLSGHCASSANVLCTATLNYELKTDDKGVENLEVGPETNTCKLVNNVTVEYNPEFVQAMSYDNDATNSYPKEKRNEFRKSIFLKEAEKAYSYFIHNIRAAAKVRIGSSFFKILH